MFILTTIADLVRIDPQDFQKSSADAVEDNINAKYANKIIQNIGLCVCVYDVLKASDGLIGHNTGIVNVNVKFRLVVFRPFKGEVIAGKIESASEHGIKVSLGFFSDILIPGNLLFPNSEFDTEEKIYIWHNAGQKYYYDLSEPVRFRVESEEWNDLGPTRGNDTNVDMMGETDTEIGARKAWRIVVSSAFDYLLCHCEESQELASQIKQHGSADSIDIQGSMSHSGLGLASWW